MTMSCRVSPTLSHKSGKNTRSFVVYTVWDNKTDNLIICDGLAKECANAMGMTVSSFYSTLSHLKSGKIKRWTILRTYLEGRDKAELE